MSNQVQTPAPPAGFEPTRLLIWAGIESVIGHAQVAGLLELGRAIASMLPGESLDAKLEAFELGPANREVFDEPGVRGRLVLLRRDIFGEGSFCQAPWSRSTQDLLRRYNQEMPLGGGALHPLHLVQHEVHRRLGNIVDLGARDAVTGEVALSARGLARVGLDAERARELLARGSTLYCVCG